jgi:hypothetical protein
MIEARAALAAELLRDVVRAFRPTSSEALSWRHPDGWRVVDDDDYRQAVGEPQTKGMMSTAASFSLS